MASTPWGLRWFRSLYSKYSSPSRSRRSRLVPLRASGSTGRPAGGSTTPRSGGRSASDRRQSGGGFGRKGLGIAGVVGGQSRGVDPEQPIVGTHKGKLTRLINGILQGIAVLPPDAVNQGSRPVRRGRTVLLWAGRFPDSACWPGRNRQSERIRKPRGFFKPKKGVGPDSRLQPISLLSPGRALGTMERDCRSGSPCFTFIAFRNWQGSAGPRRRGSERRWSRSECHPTEPGNSPGGWDR